MPPKAKRQAAKAKAVPASPAAKKPAAAEESSVAANRGVKRKRDIFQELAFDPPKANQDHALFVEKELDRVFNLCNDAFVEAPNNVPLSLLQDHAMAFLIWLKKEANVSKLQRDNALAKIIKEYTEAHRSFGEGTIRGHRSTVFENAVKQKKEEIQVHKAASHTDRVEITARMNKIATLKTAIKDVKADQAKKVKRKQNELKVVEEMTGRLNRNLRTAKQRREVVLNNARGGAPAQAMPPAASVPSAASSRAGPPAARESVLVTQGYQPVAQPKPAAKAKAKGKGKAKAKAKGAAAAPGPAPASSQETQARKDIEMDRRIRIAEAAQPIPGLMPQLNEAGKTVGWMDKNGNWISGETSRGSKKLLLHLKAINYDPRVDPDNNEDSTPVIVRPSTTPDGLRDPLTPISRLSEVGGGGSTTDIPTSPEHESSEPASSSAAATSSGVAASSSAAAGSSSSSGDKKPEEATAETRTN